MRPAAEPMSCWNSSGWPRPDRNESVRTRVVCADGSTFPSTLIVDPQILFVDEPTTGLDPAGRRDVWDAIRTLVRGGTTVLLTTQYMEEADQLADHISMLAHGRVVAGGTPAELKAQVGDDWIEFVPPPGSRRRPCRRGRRPLGERRHPLRERSSADPGHRSHQLAPRDRIRAQGLRHRIRGHLDPHSHTRRGVPPTHRLDRRRSAHRPDHGKPRMTASTSTLDRPSDQFR